MTDITLPCEQLAGAVAMLRKMTVPHWGGAHADANAVADSLERAIAQQAEHSPAPDAATPALGDAVAWEELLPHDKLLWEAMSELRGIGHSNPDIAAAIEQYFGVSSTTPQEAPATSMVADLVPPEVMLSLQRLTIGTCSCLTKTPELRFHDKHCTYRLASEVIDALATTSASHAKVKPS